MAENKQNVTSLEDGPANTVAPEKVANNEHEIFIQHNRTLSGKRMNLLIHQSGDKQDNQNVFIGLNTVGYHVPRGKTFNVPAELVENLNNAQTTFYERGDDGKVEIRSAPRFAFSATPAPDAVLPEVAAKMAESKKTVRAERQATAA